MSDTPALNAEKGKVKIPLPEPVIERGGPPTRVTRNPTTR
jgi:hypothetical protein